MLHQIQLQIQLITMHHESSVRPPSGEAWLHLRAPFEIRAHLTGRHWQRHHHAPMYVPAVALWCMWQRR